MKNKQKIFVCTLVFLLSVTSLMSLFVPAKAAEPTWTPISLPYTITGPGNYQITGSYVGSGIIPALVIESNDVIVDGQNYLLTSSVSGSAIGISSTCQNITLENINEAGVSGSPNSGTGISTYGASNVTIKDSTFVNNYWGMSLYLAGYCTAANFTLMNCNFTNNVFATQSPYASNLTFTNSAFDSNTNSIDMSNSTNVTMQSCSFSNDVDSVNLQNSTNLLIQNCNINATGTALDATNSTNFSVINSALTNSYTGLQAVNATNFTVLNCVIDNNTEEGLDARGTGNFTVKDSSLSGNGDTGLWVTQGNFTVTNCTLNGNLYGIDAENSNCLISNATINGNNEGLSIANGTATVQDTIVNGSIAGVIVDGCNATVTRCKVSFSDFYGLVAGYSNVTITNCDFTNNSIFGLITMFCNTTTIRNCNVVNSTLGIGINTYGSGDTNGDFLLVDNCAIRNNSLFGFVCGFINDSSISNNFFESNGFEYQTPLFGSTPFGGGLVLGDTNATVTDNTFSINNDALIWEVIGREENNTVTARDNNFQNNNCTMNLLNLYENSSNQQLCFYNNLVNDTYYFNPDTFTDGEGYAITSSMLHLNTTLQAGQRIYGMGSMIGGNYWAHPNGTGPSQIGVDTNKDGFLDSSFDFFGNGTIYDYLPYSSSDLTSLTVTGGANQVISAGQASSPITIQFNDSLGAITTGIAFNIASSSSTGKFYSDQACTQQISSITIPNGSSNASFYYKDTTVGTATLTASAQGTTGATTKFTINSGALDHFAVTFPASQSYGNSICVCVTAFDKFGNTVTGFSGSVSLSSSGGAVSPSSCTLTGGSWTGYLALPPASITVTAADSSGHSGTSSLINVASTTPSATPTSTPTLTPPPNPTPSPTPTPNPTVTPTTQIVQATKPDGSKVDLQINGNITSTQMSNITIATDQTAQTTTLSFTVTGTSGDSGFSNITIAKSSIPYGTIPAVEIDGVKTESQGYTQDSLNYYVWFTTSFSTHQIQVVFTGQAINAPLSPLTYPAVIAVIIIAIVAALMIVRWSRRTAKAPTQ